MSLSSSFQSKLSDRAWAPKKLLTGGTENLVQDGLLSSYPVL